MMKKDLLCRSLVLASTTLLIMACTSLGIAQATMTPDLPTATPLPGVPFTTDKVVTITSISSIVGEGVVSFTQGSEAGNLKITISGKTPVVNGKGCLFCVDKIEIGPNLIVPLDPFFMESDRPGASMSMDMSLEGPNPENMTEYILSGPQGATLRKEGNGFFLVEGEAYYVQND